MEQTHDEKFPEGILSSCSSEPESAPVADDPWMAVMAGMHRANGGTIAIQSKFSGPIYFIF